MSYARFRKTVLRAPVEEGLARAQGELRALAARLLARFDATRDPGLGPIADDGAALALWGTENPNAFLAWQAEHGGLARCAEVLIAALAYQRATYEWDSSVWALRRARPAQGLENLMTRPWSWLRDELARADRRERGRALAAVGTPRSWVVRAAVAYAFHDAPYTDADEAEARHADVDERANVVFGVLAAMRAQPLSTGAIDRAWRAAVVTPATIAKALGSRAVGPLRLVGAYAELAALGAREPDALRALAEFADRDREGACEAIASIAPSRAAVAALAPMFADGATPPRRALGYHLARGWYRELRVALGDEARPADSAWVSPWPAKAPKRVVASLPVPVASLAPVVETIHWKPGQHEAALAQGAEDRGREDRKAARIVGEAKAGSALLLELQYLSDAVALDVFRRVPSGWYAQVDDVEHVLARFGLAELDRVLALVRRKPDTLAALAHVESPRVAPLMARGFAVVKKQRDVGAAWLQRFPDAARLGLATGTFDKAQRDANARALALIDSAIAPVELPAKRPTIPAIFDVSRLPRPVVHDGTAALAGDALVELVQLVKATLPDGNPILDAAIARYTSDSLAAFAWSLFRQWLVAKGPPKEKWALHAVGRFGGDVEANALGRLARRWAPNGNPARAQEAVETLAMMRSRAGLVEIHDIARTAPSKALATRAHAVFARVAGELGITAEDLADKLVPELTEAELTFGSTRVAFDTRGVPSIPSIDASDADRWKALQKLCKQVARAQLARLEQAMADAHRMTYAHFAETYLMHPLLRELARGVVWAAYDGAALVHTFRIGDDTTPIDLRATPIELAIDRTYGVVHAAELDARERDAWSAAIGAQAIDQLARTVFPATDARTCARRLAAHVGRRVTTAALLALQRRGWRRGDAPQGGQYNTIHRNGMHAGRTWSIAVAFDPGIYLGTPTDEPTQGIGQIELRAEGEPPRAILSELERDLAGLT